MSLTYVTTCLQTWEVQRNHNAPCDYTYTGSTKQGIFTWDFLDTEGASDSTSRDITKAATWHGLETLSSDKLAPCWVVQPCSEETLWRGLWPRAVRRGAFYYPIAVKPGYRESNRLRNCSYTVGYEQSSSVEYSQKMSHTFFRRLWVWNNSHVVILRYHSIHKSSSTSITYKTRTLRWYLLAEHWTLFKLWGVKCMNIRAAKQD